jgi:hypothetical protein
MIFHSRNKKVSLSGSEIVFNFNEINKPANSSLIMPIGRIHSKHNDKKQRSFKLLGVYLDENLNLDDNTNFICSKISKSIYILNTAKNFLSKKALRTLYFALIHPHLLYCINISSCTSQSNSTRILKLQKKAIRTITNSNTRISTDPLFKDLNILPYNKLIHQGRLHLMHSIIHNYCPSSFSNLFQFNADRNINQNLRNENDIIVPNHRIDLFKRLPLYTLPVAWNELAIEIKGQSNKTTFRIALNDYLLSHEI